MKRPKALLSWSSGKDSAWTLHVLRTQHAVEVVGLLTTVNELYARVAMHAVRVKLLEAQAAAVGLPLWPVFIPSPCSNAQYEAAMGEAMDRARRVGVTAVAFGDLFLEDIRRYREAHLAPTGITPICPLCGVPTGAPARDMVQAGLKARLTCVGPRHLAPSFAGREFDTRLLASCPHRSTPVASVASSTLSPTIGPCSSGPCRCAAATLSSAMASSSRTWWKRHRRRRPGLPDAQDRGIISYARHGP